MTINRLLAMGQPPAVDVSDPNHMVVQPMSGQAMYSTEMKILHEGSAALVVENGDLRSALGALVETVGRITPTGELPEDLDEALSDAQTLLNGSAG